MLKMSEEAIDFALFKKKATNFISPHNSFSYKDNCEMYSASEVNKTSYLPKTSTLSMSDPPLPTNSESCDISLTSNKASVEEHQNNHKSTRCIKLENCSDEDNVGKKSECKSSYFTKSECDKERLSRLSKMSAYAAKRLLNETPEQRSLRLAKMSLYAARRLANETSEERALRLAKMSAYTARRLASETPEQRAARLQQMSAYSARRKIIKKISDANTYIVDKES